MKPIGGTTMPARDDEQIAISAVEHYSYCPRQCGLIHLDQIFDENVYTTRGRLAHERVDSGDDTANRGVRCVRGIPLWSDALGLFGRSDVVEFRPQPYPVEYKVGRREGIHADLQLCAQAVCLEEMLDVEVPRGAIFYRSTRQRHEVSFDARLRRATLDVLDAIRAMLDSRVLPSALDDGRCRNCSMADTCLPSLVASPARQHGLQAVLFQPLPLPTGEDD